MIVGFRPICTGDENITFRYELMGSNERGETKAHNIHFDYAVCKRCGKNLQPSELMDHLKTHYPHEIIDVLDRTTTPLKRIEKRVIEMFAKFNEERYGREIGIKSGLVSNVSKMFEILSSLNFSIFFLNFSVFFLFNFSSFRFFIFFYFYFSLFFQSFR